jgi:hypothetical protein
MTILSDLRIDLDLDAVQQRLRLKRESETAFIRDLAAAVQPLVQPKILFKACYIEEKSEDAVKVGGLQFQSRVLRKNLDAAERIFPFVITIGAKFCEDLEARSDLLEKYYLDVIGNVALNQVRRRLQNHLRTTLGIEKAAFMAPGSLPDWPIEAQRPLFQLLGDVPSAIGVSLTDSLLMLPAKSVSGIYFPTETSFFSCQLCPRERCDSRKAKYSEKLAQEYGIKR